MNKTKENAEQKMKKIKKKIKRSFDFKTKVEKGYKIYLKNNFMQYKTEVTNKNTLLGLTIYLIFLNKTNYLYI